MANDTKKPFEAELLGEEEEQDVLFKTQMWVAHIFLGYWKLSLVVVGVGLLGSLAYGLWSNHVRDSQRAIQAAMAKVEQSLPEPSPTYPITPLYDLDDADVQSRLQSGAVSLEAIADDASGTGEAMAWSRAGQLRELLGQPDKAAADYEHAYQVGAKGVIGWDAGARTAAAKAASGDVDAGAAILRAFADQDDSIIAQQALYALAQMYRDHDRQAAATSAFEEFTTRFPDSYLITEVAAAMGDSKSTDG